MRLNWRFKRKVTLSINSLVFTTFSTAGREVAAEVFLTMSISVCKRQTKIMWFLWFTSLSESILHSKINCITFSFSIGLLLPPAYSTWSEIARAFCISWSARSLIFPWPIVYDRSLCRKYSVLFSNCSDAFLSPPDTRFGESADVGKVFIGLLATSLEEDHSSSALPRLTLPKIGSSLLQNHHLWGYWVRWIEYKWKRKIIKEN